MSNPSPPPPRPFLKWAGGKARLAPAILERAPATFHRYHEPFAGAAAVFFAFAEAGRISATPSLNVPMHAVTAESSPPSPPLPRSRERGPGGEGGRLTDANTDLIEAFTVVRDRPDDLIAALEPLEHAYLPATPADRASLYYAVRAETPAHPVRRAARLIFLNRTCYNGLYRVNRRGRFNVPHGRYVRPRILDAPGLLAASAALQHVELCTGDFADACRAAGPGDFVYLDPPYHPLTRTAHFTAYTSAPFAHDEQLRLRDAFDALTARGIPALLSNSDHPHIRSLYANRGYTLETVPMSRAISAKPTTRAPIEELLVSNAAPLEG